MDLFFPSFIVQGYKGAPFFLVKAEIKKDRALAWVLRLRVEVAAQTFDILQESEQYFLTICCTNILLPINSLLAIPFTFAHREEERRKATFRL